MKDSTSKRQQLLKAASPHSALRFHEFKALMESFGFKLASMNRLHNIFVHPQINELVNVQNVNGAVKPFQVRQIINLVQRYHLRATDEPEVIFDPEAGL